MKPLNLWQRIFEHHHVTHIVDVAAGYDALAIAAAGSLEYEGVAANDVHCEWLDSTLDRCVMHLAGKDKEFTNDLGGDDASIEKVGQYFGGTMMEARRLLEPVVDGNNNDEASDDISGDS